MADEKTKAETPVPEQDETLKADAAIDPWLRTMPIPRKKQLPISA